MDHLVAACAQDGGPQNLPVSAATTIFMNPCVLPFYSARPTFVMRRFPTGAFRPLCRTSASLVPALPGGGSMYSAYAGMRSLTRRGSLSIRFAATSSASA
jgi:hypothetical protein